MITLRSGKELNKPMVVDEDKPTQEEIEITMENVSRRTPDYPTKPPETICDDTRP